MVLSGLTGWTDVTPPAPRAGSATFSYFLPNFWGETNGVSPKN